MSNVDEKYNAALNMAGYETLVRCTEDECKEYSEMDSLPEGIIRSDVIGVFYKPAQPPTAEQVDKLLFSSQIQACKNIRTIKSCVVFATVLIAIGLFVAILIPFI